MASHFTFDGAEYLSLGDERTISLVRSDLAEPNTIHEISKSALLKEQVRTQKLPSQLKVDSLVRIGRGEVCRLQLPDSGSGILRRYHRGGLTGKINQSNFFTFPNFGKHSGRGILATRPFRELIFLNYLRKENLATPEPISASVHWLVQKCCYRGVLVTKEISGVTNLLDLSYRMRIGEVTRDACGLYAQKAAECVRKVLRSGVFHADLHLGNVLVSESGEVTLIDFDKARWVNPVDELKLYVTYTINRWVQSAVKHEVSDIFVPPFVDSLMSELSKA